MANRAFVAVIAVASSFSSTGCGSRENVVSGTVTMNNQPLREGYLTLFSMDKKQGTMGAPIKDGQYTLRKVEPGKWKVVISDTPNVQIVEKAKAPKLIKVIPSADAITANTKGNQQVIEVATGAQTFDFALSSR